MQTITINMPSYLVKQTLSAEKHIEEVSLSAMFLLDAAKRSDSEEQGQQATTEETPQVTLTK